MMCTANPATFSVWFPPPGADESPVLGGSAFPKWALAEISRAYGRSDAPIRCFRLPRHEQSAVPRPALANRPEPGRRACLNVAVALAEPEDMAAIGDDIVLLRFFRRLRTVLAPGATLAVHTHAGHAQGRFTDPGGHLVLAARKTGLIYRRHLGLVHDQPQTGAAPLPSAAPASGAPEAPEARHRRSRPIHTDLYIFTTPEWSA
jgi:hypothetical protein